MVEYNNKTFCSSYEFYTLLQSSSVTTDQVSILWRKVYNKWCRSDVQMILDRARKRGDLKYLKYTTQPDGGSTRFAYSFDDILDFLKKEIPLKELTTSSGMYNIEYI